jgi:hypothetical protein
MEVLRMLEITERLKHQEESCFAHASAFSGWLATKTIENNIRKALLLRASEQHPIYRGNRWIKYSEKSIAIREI